MQYARREQDPSTVLSPSEPRQSAGSRAPAGRRIDCADGEDPRFALRRSAPRSGRRTADAWTRARRSLD